MSIVPKLPEELFFKALNSAVDAVVIADKKGMILWVNTAFEQLTGYPCHEALGKDTSFLKSGKQTDTFYKNMWNTLSLAQVWQGELWNKKKSGELYLEDQTITPVLDNNNDITHFIAIKRDVSEKIAVKRQLEHADKMDAIGHIIGGLNHHFNNKLTSIIGYSELAQELSFGLTGDFEKLTDYITHIKVSAQETKRLIDQLDFFYEKDHEVFNSTSLVVAAGEVIELIKTMLPANIHFVFNACENFDEIECDHTLIHQMLIILVHNAIDAMPEGGSITLAIEQQEWLNEPCCSCLETVNGKYLNLSLQDSGQGINKEDFKKLFLPFFTTRQMEGYTGIGLPTLHKILHKHNGHVFINSDLEKGTKINLLFPLASPHMIKPISSELTTSSLHLTHILLVDDDPSIVDSMSEILQFKGFKVTAKTSVQSALSILTQNPDEFDLLITDQNMPGISGLSLIRAIKNIKTDIPAILVSGRTRDSFDDDDNFSELVDGFLSKPFSSEALNQLIEKLIFD